MGNWVGWTERRHFAECLQRWATAGWRLWFYYNPSSRTSIIFKICEVFFGNRSKFCPRNIGFLLNRTWACTQPSSIPFLSGLWPLDPLPYPKDNRLAWLWPFCPFCPPSPPWWAFVKNWFTWSHGNHESWTELKGCHHFQALSSFFRKPSLTFEISNQQTWRKMAKLWQNHANLL